MRIPTKVSEKHTSTTENVILKVGIIEMIVVNVIFSFYFICLFLVGSTYIEMESYYGIVILQLLIGRQISVRYSYHMNNKNDCF